MTEVTNVCAGPFGAFYDFYIERPRLAQLIGRAVWGVDLAPLYRSMAAVAELPDGATVLDVPCGGGVALRALRPGQDVRWIAVDVEPKMLARCARRTGQNGSLVAAGELRAMLEKAGIADVEIAPERGFAVFRGRRSPL